MQRHHCPVFVVFAVIALAWSVGQCSVQCQAAYLPPMPPVLSGGFVEGVVRLNWTDSTPLSDPTTRGNPRSEIGYRIQRAIGPRGAFRTIGGTFANTTSYWDTSATVGTTHRYRVAAYNGAGETLSNVIAIGSVPIPPSKLVAMALSPLQIVLTWKTNPGNVTGLQMQRATSADFVQGLITVAVGKAQTTYVDNTPQPNTTYYYHIRARNPDGYSDWSNTAVVKTPDWVLVAPTGLAASVIGTTFVTVAWSYPSRLASGFYIERSANRGANWIRVGVTTGRTLSFRNTFLWRRTTYMYRVQAYNSRGFSPYSSILTVTTL